MPIEILAQQRRLREAGRIRIGDQVETRNGKRAPRRLGTFRFTSADEHAIRSLAQIYGGDVEKWDDAPVGEQWQVTTNARRLPVLVPPGSMAFSQWLESWSGGGCQRRCDGKWEMIGDQPCVCDPDARECKPHTRLSVILADLPGVGMYRLESSSYYSAIELAGTIEVVQMLASRGRMVEGWLSFEKRQSKRPGEQTKTFPVVTLDLDFRVRDLMSGGSQEVLVGPSSIDDQAALPSGEQRPEPPQQQQQQQPEPMQRPRITPVPPGPPGPSVAEQTAAVNDPTPARRRGPPPPTIPRTGLAPRTAAAAGRRAAHAEAGFIPAKIAQARASQETVAAMTTESAGPNEETGQREPAPLTQRIVLACRDADVDRHDLIHAVTGGRKRSSREVTPEEAEQVLRAAHEIAQQRAFLVIEENGPVVYAAEQVGRPLEEPSNVIEHPAVERIPETWRPSSPPGEAADAAVTPELVADLLARCRALDAANPEMGRVLREALKADGIKLTQPAGITEAQAKTVAAWLEDAEAISQTEPPF